MVVIGDLLKVTRDEILDFPGDTIDLIMGLQKEGWRAQRSNRNHVMLFAPDGVTKYSASRNASSAKYLAEDIARYNRGDKSIAPESIERVEEMATVPKAAKKFPCPQKDCNKSFASQDFLNVHIGVDHEGLLACPEKDCYELFHSPQALGRHRQAKHGYVSPKKAQRKAQEAARAERKILDEVDGIKVEETTIDAPKEIVGSVTVFDPPLEFHHTDPKPQEGLDFSQHNASPKSLSAEELYRQAEGKLRAYREAVKDSAVVRTDDDIEFLDTRDSWVVDHSLLGRRRIRDLEEMFGAAGLKMEIRVWKEE